MSRPLALLLLLLLLPAAAGAGAEPGSGLVVERLPEGFKITHAGTVPVIALRAGDRTLAQLAPGASLTVHAAEPPVVAARFPLDRWAEALGDVGPGWADVHLRTAGAFLDALDPGPDADPGRSRNLRLLATVDPQIAADWVGEGAVRLALAARAARHVPPGPLLDRLLAAALPTGDATPFEAPYDALEPLPDLVRLAIEGGGPAALPILLRHPVWAADRGFDEARLALAFEAAAPPAATDAAAVDLDATVEALRHALGAGDFGGALSPAITLALAPAEACSGDAARMACAALDVNAQRATAADQWLAAQASLRLAAPLCGDSRSFRLRSAELLRAQGDGAFAAADLVTASGWYRGALFLGGDAADRARLADTLADLALLRLARDDLEAARPLVAQAKEIDPLRPRVQAALNALPTVDPRARAAIVIIILFLLVFAVRRLRRIFRPSVAPPPTVRRPRR